MKYWCNWQHSLLQGKIKLDRNEHNNPEHETADNIRERLRELGYLQSPVEKFIGSNGGNRVTPALTVALRFSLIVSVVIGLLTSSAAIIARPELVSQPSAIFGVCISLFALFLVISFLLIIIPALIWKSGSRLARDFGGAGRVRSIILSSTVSFIVTVYLLGWWHIVGVSGGHLKPLGIISLTVVAAIFLVCLAAGRLTVFVYYFLAGPPEHSRDSTGPIFRSYLYSGLVCLIISVTWMIGVYPYHAAFNSIDQAIEEQPAEPIPLLVIGLDGVDSETMSRLVANDSLPNLKKLIAGGFSTPIESRPGYLAPQIWNTISTGMHPERHGIQRFTVSSLRGVPWLNSLTFSNYRVDSVLELAFPFRDILTRTKPVSSAMRNNKTVWEILELFGVKTGVVNWWASWPAVYHNGFTISERTFPKINLAIADLQTPPMVYHEQEVYPEKEFRTLVDLNLALDDRLSSMLSEHSNIRLLLGSLVPTEAGELIRSVFLSDLFHVRATIRMEDKYEVGALFVYLQGADILSRIEERTNLVRADAINKVIPEYYVFLDKLVGELIMNYNPGSITAVIMDPGKIGRANREKGHLVLSGVDIVPSSVTDHEIKLEDIAPTLLYFTGVPVSRDMGGRVVTEAGEPGPGGAPPLRYVVSYGPPSSRYKAVAEYKHDSEYLERLRSLGYVK